VVERKVMRVRSAAPSVAAETKARIKTANRQRNVRAIDKR